MAIASPVTGVLGFVGPVLYSIIALIARKVAHAETRSVPPVAGSDALATTSIVMGWIQIGLVGLALCVALALRILGIGVRGSLISQ